MQLWRYPVIYFRRHIFFGLSFALRNTSSTLPFADSLINSNVLIAGTKLTDLNYQPTGTHQCTGK